MTMPLQVANTKIKAKLMQNMSHNKHSVPETCKVTHIHQYEMCFYIDYEHVTLQLHIALRLFEIINSSVIDKSIIFLTWFPNTLCYYKGDSNVYCLSSPSCEMNI